MSWFLDPASIALVGATERSLWPTNLVGNFRTRGSGGEVRRRLPGRVGARPRARPRAPDVNPPPQLPEGRRVPAAGALVVLA